MGHKEAKAYSADAITDEHFDYSEEGKSRMQRTDIGAVALAFKSYPIKMAYYMANNIRKIKDPATRAEATKRLFGTLAMTGIIGGSMALPMVSAVMVVMDMADDDDDWDAHKAFYEWAEEATGSKEGAEILANGLVSYMTGTSLTGRVSLTDMFYRIPQGGGTPGDWFEEAFKSVSGPVSSRIASVPKGFDLMGEGKLAEGLEKFIPAALANVSKATRGLERGSAYNAYDAKMEEDFDEIDAFKRAFGFASKEYESETREYYSEKRTTTDVKRKKSRLIRRMALAQVAGSSADKSEAREAIREYNSTHSDSRISRTSIRRRVKYIEGE